MARNILSCFACEYLQPQLFRMFIGTSRTDNIIKKITNFNEEIKIVEKVNNTVESYVLITVAPRVGSGPV